ncbi:MAG: Uma2 family endonuclease [Treponema sp.]|jgi:Uma2 family endonuclease|nr:Uma2 family endonuclease [Treponema sp.]
MADPAELTEERRFTYADYKGWDLAEGERYELIYGAAYAMSAPSLYHQAILMELGRQFANYLYGKPCKVYPAPLDVRLFYQEDGQDDTVVQPDLAVICDEKKRGKEGCRGAPDLVAEILSPSNTAIEMARKFELYRKAGVREYWIVNPEPKALITHRFHGSAITTHSYGSADTVPVDILPGLAIGLEPVFAE